MGRGLADRNLGRVVAGRYRLLALLAEGGMGKVYEAEQADLPGRRVALKMLLPGAASDPVSYERFRREAEICSRIGHPHIVAVLAFEQADGLPFMVMELLEGRTLAELLVRGPLPRAIAVEVLGQMGSALRAVHELGVVHRDLKPQKVFLVDEPDRKVNIKVLDFGLSKIKHRRSDLTQANPIFGTPFYMAPELAEGRTEEVDHRADIFSSAVIAYQCLTGKLPFDGATGPDVLYMVTHAEPRPPSACCPDLPTEVDAILARGLAKRRAERYPTVDELTGELCRVLARVRDTPAQPADPGVTKVMLQAPRASRELTPTIETEPLTTIELTGRGRPDEEARTTVELLDDVPADPTDEIEVEPAAGPQDLTPPLERLDELAHDRTPVELTPPMAPREDRDLELTPQLEGPPEPVERTLEIEPPRRRWSHAGLLAALLGVGLVGIGVVLAVLIIGSVPAEEPGRVAAAPAAASRRDAAAAAPVAADPDAAVVDGSLTIPDLPPRLRAERRVKLERASRATVRLKTKRPATEPKRAPVRRPPEKKAPEKTPVEPKAPAKKPDDKIRYDEL